MANLKNTPQTKKEAPNNFDPVIYEDRNRNKLHSFIRIDDEEVAIVDDQETLEQLRLSALQSEEKDRQRVSAIFKFKKQTYKQLLEGELNRIMTVAKVDKKTAGSLLHQALNNIKKDFYDICLNADNQFVPSVELVQHFVTETIKKELVRQRDAREIKKRK